MNTKKALALALLPVSAATILFARTLHAAPSEVPASSRSVRVVKAGAPGGGALVPATVHAARRATIATRLAASVTAVNVLEGQRVKAGELLVSLSDADVRGGLQAAETALGAARTHERRIRALVEQGASAPAELDIAVAQRAQASAAAAGARTNLGYTQLRAPFDGTVAARRIDPGDLVGPGQPVIELESDGLELQASLSDEETGALAVGSEVAFESGALRGTAIVTALTPGGDPITHRRTLRAEVKDAPAELRAGAFARLEVPGAARSSRVFVPRTALVERGDLTGVYVVQDGKVELRWIARGESAGDWVAVRAGVRREEPVVNEPGVLEDGQIVEVIQ